MTVPKLGFACKLSELHPTKGAVSIPEYNTGGTTMTWLRRQTKHTAEEKLWELVKHNIESTRKLVEKVGSFDEHLRMVRLSSDILPGYTHRDWSYFFKLPEVRSYCESKFAEIGRIGRAKQVRLSMHPGQFTVLASDNPGIVNNSIEEFEYHADMVRWMGYGQQFQDFKINVHISGKQGAQGIRLAHARLSPEARNCITIENEEISHGLDACLGLIDLVPIVLDIHHHWVKTGEYIAATDPRIEQIKDSWRGVRPVVHYSISREDVLVDHDTTVMPDLGELLASGYKKQKIRAHSDYYWNTAVNEWALTHTSWADIMCESKAKNLASFELAKGLK